MNTSESASLLSKLHRYARINYRYATLGKRMCVFLPNARIGFVFVPKCASTSLRESIAQRESLPEREDIYETVIPLHEHVATFSARSCPKFALVRNPLERIASCYNHIAQNTIPFQFFPSSLLVRKPTNFATFVDAICRVPDALADPHFASQHSLLTYKDAPLVDHILPVEHAENVYEQMLRPHGIEALAQRNVRQESDKWRALYTPSLAKKVHDRYRKDFTFGEYEKTYQDFLRTLASNQTLDS